MRSEYGRSRIVARVLADLSRHCWRRASESSAWRRIGWANLAKGSASRASRTRSTRSRSLVRRQGRCRAVLGRVSERAGDGDPAAARSSQRSRRERTGRSTAALAPARAVPRARALLKRGALNQRGCLTGRPTTAEAASGARIRIVREQVAQLRCLTARSISSRQSWQSSSRRTPAAAGRAGLRRVDAAILIGHTPASSNSANTQALGCRRDRLDPRSQASALNIDSTRRRSPAQPRAAHHRGHCAQRDRRPRSTSPARKPKARREGRAALPQALPRTPLLRPPRRAARRPASRQR